MPTAYLLCLYREGMPVHVCVSPVQQPDGCEAGEQWVEVCIYSAETDERERLLDACASTLGPWRFPDTMVRDKIARQPLAVRRAIARMGVKRCGQPVLVSDFVEGLTPAARNELAAALAATEAHAVMVVEVEKRQVSGTSALAQWRNADDVRRIAELEATSGLDRAAMKAMGASIEMFDLAHAYLLDVEDSRAPHAWGIPSGAAVFRFAVPSRRRA